MITESSYVYSYCQPLTLFGPAVCGAPYVNWKIAKDLQPPPGWKTKGFSGHVGNFRFCGNGWNAYARWDEQGQLYAKMKGAGRATVNYRDCWKEGFVGLYLNGKQLDKSPENNGHVRTYRCSACVTCDVLLRTATQEALIATPELRSFDFKDGDVLMFKDEGANSVLHIESILYQCAGTMLSRITSGLGDIATQMFVS